MDPASSSAPPSSSSSPPPPSDLPSVLTELEAFKAGINAEALHIVDDLFPAKIASLGGLYRSFGEEQRNRSVPIAAPVDPCASGTPDVDIGINDEVCQLFQVMKREVVELVDMLATLRLWVQLNVPRIEDGNNFGVGVQQEIMSMLDSGRSSGVAVLSVIQGYFYRRGHMITDSLKSPGIADFMRGCVDADEKQCVILRQSTLDLRNNYCMLLDKIVKNRDKLCQPKGSASAFPSMMY